MSDNSPPPACRGTVMLSALGHAVTGLLLAFAATFGITLLHMLIFDSGVLGQVAPESVMEVAPWLPLHHLLFITGAFAILVPSVFAAACQPGRHAPSPGLWATAAALVAAACYAAVLWRAVQDPRVFVRAALPVATIWIGVRLLLKRVNREAGLLQASARERTAPFDGGARPAHDADGGSRRRIPSAWVLGGAGLVMAVVATVAVGWLQAYLFDAWRDRMGATSGLSRDYLAWMGIDLLFAMLLDFALFAGAFAAAVPLAYAARRRPGAPKLSVAAWTLGATLVSAPVLLAGMLWLEWPLLPHVLIALPPMPVMAVGVWVQTRWANRALARAYGTPEAPRS